MQRSYIPSGTVNNERESAKLSGIHKTKNNSAFEADLEDSVVNTSAELTEKIEYRAKSLETFVAGLTDSLEKNADLVEVEVKRPAGYVATDYIISSKESYKPSDCVTTSSDSLGDEAKYQPDGVNQSLVSSADIADSTALKAKCSTIFADLLMDSRTVDSSTESAHSLRDTTNTNTYSVVDTLAELTENIEYRAKSLEMFVAGPMDSLEKNADLVVVDVKRTADYVATDYNFAAIAELSGKESYIPSDCVTRASDSLGDEAKYQPDGVYQSVLSTADIADSTADLLMDSPTAESACSLMDTTTTTGEEKDLNLFVPAIPSVVCSATIEGKERTMKKEKIVRKVL
jgi:hypothetical protein